MSNEYRVTQLDVNMYVVQIGLVAMDISLKAAKSGNILKALHFKHIAEVGNEYLKQHS